MDIGNLIQPIPKQEARTLGLVCMSDEPTDGAWGCFRDATHRIEGEHYCMKHINAIRGEGERVITEAVRFADAADPNRESQQWSARADDEWDYHNDDDSGE